MKTAYSFIRWSTKRQNNENRDSKARQEKSAVDWIKHHSNGEYVLSKDVFISDGKSASKGEHIAKDEFGKAKGELAKFIEQVKDGTIASNSILLFDSWDRFSRLPVRKTIALLNDVVDNCGGIVVTGSRDKRVLTAKLLDEDEYLLSGIIGEMNRATHESSEKRRKIIEAQERKLLRLKNGEILKHHCAPRYYSYNASKKCYEQNNLTPIVNRIIDEYLSGKSLYRISHGLNKEKVRSLRYFNVQANWSRMAIKSILESKCLYGEFLGIPNYFGEPVIDRETWEKLQMMLSRGKRGRYSSEHINIFKSTGRCSDCKRAMVTGVQSKNYKSGKMKPKPYRFLRCSSRSNALPCGLNGSFNLAEVEESFFTDFLCKNPIDLINGDDKKEIKAINKEILERQTKLNLVERKIDDLGGLLAVVSSDKLRKDGKELNDERERLNSEIDALNAKRASIMAAPSSRDLLVTAVEFGSNSDGTDKETKTFAPYSFADIQKSLSNNETRQQLQISLPNLFEKIEFNSNEQTYTVFNRSGKVVFKSESLNEKQIAAKALKLINSKEERAKTLKMTGRELQMYLETIKAKIRATELAKRKSHGKPANKS